MSQYDNAQRISLLVNSDQSGSEYRFAKGSGVGIEKNDVDGGPIVGVIDANDGDTSGKTVPVVIGGVAKVACGVACAIWLPVTSDNTGRVKAAAAGDIVHGIALKAGTTAGDLMDILLTPNGYIYA